MKAAIYSRKSVFTGKGDSIENQIALCKEYAEKYLDEIDEFLIYEDEGFSGVSINRPEFQRLLKDAKQKRFDILICYRLDRISRNVADFSSTLELLQEMHIAFVSVREQFDTSTPMGKAMVYIASVFAQLERDTIAERIKDNMLELAKSGRWLGGQCPLGFESEQITYFDSEYNERILFKLQPIKNEMAIVMLIYDKYYETRSVNAVLKYLLSNNIRGKNGGEFASSSVSDILRNPVYVSSDDKVLHYLKSKGIQTCGDPNGNGILIYNKRNSKYKSKKISEWIAAVSKHKGIIPSDKWLQIQNMLDKNSKKRNPRQGTSKKALLSGLLKCAKCGAPMRVSYGRRKKCSQDRIYYYTCTKKAQSGRTRCNNPNVRGDYLEKQIIDELLEINIDAIIKELENKKKYSPVNQQNAYKKSISKDLELKKKEIRSLVSQLSKIDNPVAQSFLVQKINSVGDEIIQLEQRIPDTGLLKNEDGLSNLNVLVLIDALKSFNNFFIGLESFSDDEYIFNKKKYLLETIIDKITVDGFTKDVVIYLWGTSKK